MLAVKVKLFIGTRILAQMRFKNVGEIDSSQLLIFATSISVVLFIFQMLLFSFETTGGLCYSRFEIFFLVQEVVIKQCN